MSRTNPSRTAPPERPSPGGGRARRAGVEAIWIGAAALAAARVVGAYRHAVPPTPEGPDWNQYLTAAWKVVHHVAVDYPRFRLPLYPWAVATLAGGGPYQSAAEALSLAGTLAALLAAAVLARTLAGPAAAAAASAVALAIPQFVSASRWTGQYAPLGGIVGLALALGAVAGRTGAPALAGLAGVAGGLAWATDVRGTVALVLAATLAASGPGGPARRLVAVGLFTLGAVVGPVAQARLDVIPRPAAASLLLEQRANALREDWAPLPAPVEAACADVATDRLPSPRALLAPCGRAILASNRARMDGAVPFGLVGTAAGLLAGVLAARGARRRLHVALAVGAPAAALVYASLLVPELPERYVLAFATPLAAVVPVAVGLVGARAGGFGRVCAGTALVALAGWRLVGPVQVHLPDRDALQARDAWRVALDRAVPPEAPLLDCAPNVWLGIAVVPAHAPPDPADLADGARAATCRAWLATPPAAPAAMTAPCRGPWTPTAGWVEVYRAGEACLYARTDADSSGATDPPSTPGTD